MAEAKLAPKMQEWQVEHTNLYLKSGGKEGHVMKRTPPGGYPEMDTYSLAITDHDRSEVGGEICFPALLWRNRKRLHPCRLEGWGSRSSRLVQESRGQS